MELFQYERLREMNESELMVYNYVSTHVEEIEQMNIRELSAATGVSTTTVLRFCSKLGCEGYKEFKYQLNKSLAGQKKQHVYFPSIIHAIQFLQKAAESQSLNEQLERTAEWCIQARQVLFTGMGASGNLVGYGSRLLSDMGITSFVIMDPFYPMPLRNKNLSLHMGAKQSKISCNNKSGVQRGNGEKMAGKISKENTMGRE